MEMKAKEKTNEDHLRAVWFAAGTALVVACLQRAAVVSLVEQWRLWVFLTLNLLLLAILFTSSRFDSSVSSNETSQESNADEQHETNESKKGRKHCRRMAAAVLEDGGGGRLKFHKTRGSLRDNEREEVEDDDAAKPTHLQLSKEELNERVETFIATFRQQLVSDAKDRSRFRYSAGARKHFA